MTSEENRRVLSFVGLKPPTAELLEFQLPHLAFSISIEPPNQKIAKYLELFSRFGDVLEKGPRGDIDDLAKQDGINLDKGRKAASNGRIQAMLSRALPKGLADIQKHHIGGGIFDFTHSSGARELNQLFTKGLTIGNGRKAEVKRLIVDVISGSISVDVDLISKEEWSRDDILRQGEKFWTETDKTQGELFKKAHNDAKQACDDLSKQCRSLAPDQLKACADKLCGSYSRHETLALQSLPPAVPTECDWLAADPDDPDRDRYAGAGKKWITADDARKAVKVCFEQVAKTPSVARFHYQLGRAHQQSGQHKEARAAFEKAADLGHEQAMFMLYDDSHGDSAGRLKWLEASANLGNPIAMARLGGLYAGGWNYKELGVVPDPNRAKSWSERAIEAGSADAALTLFYLYNDGKWYSSKELIKKDAAEAAKYILTYIKLGGAYSYYEPDGLCRSTGTGSVCFSRTWPALAVDLDKSVVREIQLILIRDGYLRDKADGIPGPNTEKALNAWIAAAKSTTAPLAAAPPTSHPATRSGSGMNQPHDLGPPGGGQWLPPPE